MKNHFCLDTACTAKGEIATKPVGSGFDGSEPAGEVLADYSGSSFYNDVQSELFLHCERSKPYCD